MILFIAPHTLTQLGTTGNYSAIAIMYTSRITVTHALGFSVFTRRILATDSSQSHYHFNSYIKSSWHSLIPLFAFLQLPLPKTQPVQFLYSLAQIPAGWRSETRLFTTRHYSLLPNSSYNNFARTTLKTACIVGESCLPCRFLAMVIHVIICFGITSPFATGYSIL
jgi:hypothetical protein